MRKPCAVLSVVLVAMCCVARGRDPSGVDGSPAGIVSIENAAVRVELDPADGRLMLSDRRCRAVWRQSDQRVILPQVKSASRQSDGRSMRAELDSAAGPVELVIELQDPAEALVRLIPRGAARASRLTYPLPLAPPEDAELVLPVDEGVLLPATAIDFPNVTGHYQYRQSGFLMPWFGVVQGEQGLMVMVETPDDLQLRVTKTSLTGQATTSSSDVLSPGVVWLPSRDELRYERRLRFCLFDRGGYVAMAKRYRKYLVDTGRFRTLADKARELPDVDKLLGAIDVHDRSGPRKGRRGPDVLDWMIENGLRRAVYYGPADRQRNEKALAAGFVTARYDLYTDIAPPELLAMRRRSQERHKAVREGYPDEAFVRRDGSLKPGFPYPVNAKGGVLAAGQELKSVWSVYRCSSAKLARLKRDVPEEAVRLALHARFLDVETASAPSECYSPQHPLTRSDDRRLRTELFDYLRSNDQIAASEGGADWPAHALHYQEGSLSLNRYSYPKGIYVGTAPFDLTDEYVAVQFTMARRVPLHKLVYHDSILMTWRWNCTPNRWVKGVEYWDQWDLLHILYGGMPIFVVDSANLARKGPRILKSYGDICGVLEKTAGSEMLAHRFLTPDRQVQETMFANGWRVTVNFDSEETYQSPDGTMVGPKGFAVSRNKE